jgi:hypothetical protein
MQEHQHQQQMQQMQQQQIQQQRLQEQQPHGNSQMKSFVHKQQQLSSQQTPHHSRPQQAPPPQQQLQPQTQPQTSSQTQPQAPSQQQQPQQQFLPGPFYTLQQQQAFAQARMAQAAKAQQWQQQQAKQQQQTQAQLQEATVAAAQQQQVIFPTYSLVGHTQHQLGPVVGGGVGAVAQISRSTPSSGAAAALGVKTALNFGANPSVSSTAIGGGLVMPPAVMGAPLATFIAPVPIKKRSRKRGVGPELKPNDAAADDDDNRNPTPIRKVPTPRVAAAARKNSSSGGGTVMLPPSIASETAGICSSAAILIQNAMDESNNCDIPPNEDVQVGATNCANNADVYSVTDRVGKPTTEQKRQVSRDRNREHARCTRLRKKAYVTKLKEIVDGLHAERNEDVRKRRVAVQRLAEIQELRRKVVHTFLDYHCKFEGDYNKWSLILESGGGDGNDKEEFWLKQPVTPYRSFRRSEIQKVRYCS